MTAILQLAKDFVNIGHFPRFGDKATHRRDLNTHEPSVLRKRLRQQIIHRDSSGVELGLEKSSFVFFGYAMRQSGKKAYGCFWEQVQLRMPRGWPC